MNTTKNFNLVLGLFILFSAQVLLSCEESTSIVTPEISNDYFPLSDNTQLDYLKKTISTGDDGSVYSLDTLKLTVLGDTLIEDIAYKKIVNEYGSLQKVVRKEGTQYFGRNHELYGGFSREYMFLDTSVPVNGSWEHVKNEGMTKTEYIVKAVDATHTVNGYEYQNVIKLEVNYYNKFNDGINFELAYSTEHYYAGGIGEIYAYYPYPASGLFAHLNLLLLPQQN